MAASVMYYFGCLKEKGHYWFAPGGDRLVGRREHETIPIEFWAQFIDGRLPPRVPVVGGEWPSNKRQENVGALWHLETGGKCWTALAWWDLSVDDRPGSNSVLLADEILTVGEMKEWGIAKFPSLKARIEAIE